MRFSQEKFFLCQIQGESLLLHILFVSISLSTTVVSIDNGMKTCFAAIWMRQSGKALGSGSKEKDAASTVKTLDRGRESTGAAEAREGMAGMRVWPSVCTLEMRKDHSEAKSPMLGWGCSMD